VPSAAITAVPSAHYSVAPATGGSSGGTRLSTYLEIVAVLAGLALVAGLVGLYLTRDRKLPPVVAAGTVGAAGLPGPPPPPAPGSTSPRPDADHDWGTQTPGPPPPPPPPGPIGESDW
jgi:hypothetical protein